MELNASQIRGFLRVGLSAGGPLGAVVITKTGINATDYGLYLEALLYCVPVGMLVWTWIDHRITSLVKAVVSNKNVATVVVKDGVNGTLGAMAQSDVPANSNIVTETQNEKDAKNGTKI